MIVTLQSFTSTKKEDNYQKVNSIDLTPWNNYYLALFHSESGILGWQHLCH